MRTRVLMIGPASLGGISGLIRTLLPILGQYVDLLFFATVQKRPPKEAGRFSPGNITLALSQFVRYIITIIKFHPNIVHLHTSQGIGWIKDTFFIITSKILGVPVLLHMHAADFNKFYAKTPHLMQAYTRWVLRRVDAVISVSEQWKNLIVQIVPPEKVFKFINCISVKGIKAHTYPLSPNGITALFMGAVGERKGVPELLEAMSRLKSRELSIHLWIAGPEEKMGDLAFVRSRIADLHLEGICELTGDVREDRKATLLEKADLFVLPSHHEGLPIAMLEGMAAGLAVISTPVGGIPEIIRDGYNGFLVAPGNADALAEKIALLAEDTQLCRRMGERNRKIAEQELNVDAYVVQLVQLYQQIL